jgi:sulfofructose kinase
MTTVTCVGMAVLDLVFATAELPRGPGKHFATELREVGGGPAANAAVTVVALGGNAKLIGCVGDDARGEKIISDLQEYGVDTAGLRQIPGLSSPLSAIFVDSTGERMIVNHTDARLLAVEGPVRPEDAADANAVLADVRWHAGAKAALRAATAAGIPAILDFDVHTSAHAEELLGIASHIVFSAAALAGVTGTHEPAEGLRRVRGRTSSWIAVTAGADGAYWLERSEIHHFPAFPVDVVDTLGAGDVFHGAFALELGSGTDEEGAIRMAAAAAAIKCTRFGGRAGIPSRSEVETHLLRRWS